MNYEINKITKKEILGKEVDVIVTNIQVKEDTVYLDGGYTKNELEGILLNGIPNKTIVYGKVVKDEDVNILTGLQELLTQSRCNCSGAPFIKTNYTNEILLDIFRNGEQPDYDEDED